MKPGTKEALEQAQRRLRNAQKMLAHEMPDEAADAAYNFYLRTMEAYLFEKGQTPPKDHGRVRANFLAVSAGDGRLTQNMPTKISAAAHLKNANDYGTISDFITQAEAEIVVADADRFLQTIKDLIKS